MTYVREVTKLTIITLVYIDYFYRIWHWSPWRSGSVGGSWIHVSRVQISVTTCFFFCFVLFFLIFFIYFFFMFFLSLLLQCKFANSTLLSLLSFSNFITPYDAQASSAFSALILPSAYLFNKNIDEPSWTANAIILPRALSCYIYTCVAVF